MSPTRASHARREQRKEGVTRHPTLTTVAAPWLIAVATMTGAPGAMAQEADATQPATRALVPSIVYDGTVLTDLKGGARTGTTSVGNLHIKLAADGTPLGWPGLTAFADVLTIRGGRPSNRVGDAQGVSNLEAPTGTQVEELWVQQNFARGDSVLVGIYDLNSEFYRLQGAGLFQNSSFGIGPEFAQSGVEGPSIFPRTSAALRFAVHPTHNTVLRVAVLDGVPIARPDGTHGIFRKGDGLLMIAELAVLTRVPTSTDQPPSMRNRIGRFSSLAPYDDKLAVGAWRYTAKFDDLSDVGADGQPTRHASSGAYVIGERRVFEADGPTPRRASAFVQLGYADPRVNRFERYVGGGVVATGWGLLKPEDEWGLSFARATNGSHYQRSIDLPDAQRAETTFEITYLTQAFKHLALQPDLQYVKHPNTDPSRANAWVAQVRFEIGF
jgi:porin